MEIIEIMFTRVVLLLDGYDYQTSTNTGGSKDFEGDFSHL